jgi:hypothetical protein
MQSDREREMRDPFFSNKVLALFVNVSSIPKNVVPGPLEMDVPTYAKTQSEDQETE